MFIGWCSRLFGLEDCVPAAVYLFLNHATVSMGLLQAFFLGNDDSCVEIFLGLLYDLMLTWSCTVAFVHRISPMASLICTVSPALSGSSSFVPQL